MQREPSPQKLLVCLGLAATHAFAQYAWHPSALSGRAYACLGHDPTHAQTLLFGGGGTQTDSWAWTGSNWTEQLPVTRPTLSSAATIPIAFQSMVYDSTRRRLLVMMQDGGGGGMWEWDGSAWSLVGKALPFDYYRAGMAYDAARRKVVLFGGSHNGAGGGDDTTWLWDGVQWTKAIPATKPGPRPANAGIAYDVNRARVVLFGGSGDTWEWDGANWQMMSPSTTTASRGDDVLAYHDRLGCVVRCSRGSPQDAYLWINATWLPIGNGPAPTFTESATMVYDSRRATLMLLGANRPQNPSYTYVSETWELTGSGWQRLWTSESPGSREYVATVFDSISGQVLIVGDGSQSPGPFEPWTWDGSHWTRLVSATGNPAPRGGVGIAHDGKTLVFGGAVQGTGNNALGDMWQWDGVSWTQLAPPRLPPPRYQPAMCYDLARNRTLLFGGRAGAQVGPWSSDTWEWNGSTWSQLSPVTSPPALSYPVLACDAARARMVLVGVGSATWEWDGSNWSMNAAAGPPLGAQFSMTYDDQARRVLLSGYRQVSNFSSVLELWEWSGSAWSQRVPGTGAVSGPIVWDPRRKRLVAFTNGYPWDCGPDRPPSASSFGAGCAGSAGTPALAAGTLPWLGESFVLALPSASATALLLGASRTAWGPAPLPLPLGGVGMPGCTLLTSIDVTFPLAGNAAALPIPGSIALVGQAFYVQGIVADPVANPLGAVTSNALEVRVGGR